MFILGVFLRLSQLMWLDVMEGIHLMMRRLSLMRLGVVLIGVLAESDELIASTFVVGWLGGDAIRELADGGAALDLHVGILSGGLIRVTGVFLDGEPVHLVHYFLHPSEEGMLVFEVDLMK